MPVNRDNLLVGAAHLLDEAGTYDGLTIDALASSLKMSKSTLYKHFESKDQLIHALIVHLTAASEHDLASTLSRQAPPVEALRAWFETYARHADRVPRALLLQPDKLPRACRQRTDEVRRQYASAVLDIVERGTQAGQFRAASGRAAGHAIACGVEAGVMGCARGEIPGPRSSVVRGLQALFAAGLGLPAGALAPV